MNEVAFGKNDKCPPEDQGLRAKEHFELLQEVYKNIKSLAVGGEEYKKLKCHIYRDSNPNYGKKQTQSQDVSQFVVLTWTNKYSSGPDARVIQVKYWCIYDLIGLFFSLLGSARPAANKNNFFLPLTTVYARWCTRLAGKMKYDKAESPGIGPVPEMYQCTWRDRDDGTGVCFFLGASLGGDSFANNLSGQDWKKMVQKTRLDVLVTHQQATMVNREDFGETEPEIRTPGGKGTFWGNCAETYPFAHCMKSGIAGNANVKGLAIGKKFIDRRPADGLVENYSGYCDDTIWQSMVPPCRNCARLVYRCHAVPDNFDPNDEIAGAAWRNPPAPPQEPEVEAAEAFVIRDMKESLIQEMVEVASN
ncbi:hypothetical protein ACHAPE_008074 [Trichoderma viride]